MIRDWTVVGLQDAQLSEELQLTSDLILEKAVTKARQSEAIKQQQAVVRASSEVPQNVDALYGRIADRSSSGSEPSRSGTGSLMCTRAWCTTNLPCQKCDLSQVPQARSFSGGMSIKIGEYAQHSTGGSISWHSTAQNWLHWQMGKTLLVNGTPIV